MTSSAQDPIALGKKSRKVEAAKSREATKERIEDAKRRRRKKGGQINCEEADIPLSSLGVPVRVFGPSPSVTLVHPPDTRIHLLSLMNARIHHLHILHVSSILFTLPFPSFANTSSAKGMKSPHPIPATSLTLSSNIISLPVFFICFLAFAPKCHLEIRELLAAPVIPALPILPFLPSVLGLPHVSILPPSLQEQLGPTIQHSVEEGRTRDIPFNAVHKLLQPVNSSSRLFLAPLLNIITVETRISNLQTQRHILQAYVHGLLSDPSLPYTLRIPEHPNSHPPRRLATRHTPFRISLLNSPLVVCPRSPKALGLDKLLDSPRQPWRTLQHDPCLANQGLDGLRPGFFLSLFTNV
ncbi:hypothetical protein BKA70DRAFT_1432638 [Coprinopsis sp. MPI-PUGE-AT-0042]|nr:hypothetical protein BKA70DRAFT_1432638 [Coprinopsis sp. MPI-PUGE-AT-0042]